MGRWPVPPGTRAHIPTRAGRSAWWEEAPPGRTLPGGRLPCGAAEEWPNKTGRNRVLMVACRCDVWENFAHSIAGSIGETWNRETVQTVLVLVGAWNVGSCPVPWCPRWKCALGDRGVVSKISAPSWRAASRTAIFLVPRQPGCAIPARGAIPIGTAESGPDTGRQIPAQVRLQVGSGRFEIRC
jgi:hypothetical protein